MAANRKASKGHDGAVAYEFLSKHHRLRPGALARHYLCACGHAQAIAKLLESRGERDEFATHNQINQEIWRHYEALRQMHRHDLGLILQWRT
jgi:hypothetical protein